MTPTLNAERLKEIRRGVDDYETHSRAPDRWMIGVVRDLLAHIDALEEELARRPELTAAERLKLVGGVFLSSE